MSTNVASGHYVVDNSHSSIAFVARHAMITKVRGVFSDYVAEATFNADDPTASSLNVTIKAASIDTGISDRDAHLRGDDFLASDTYPEITFNSTAVKADGDDTYEVTGDFTMHGVTKSVTFTLELTGAAVDPFGNDRVGIEARTVINRKDFGLNWNAALEAGGVLVSEKVTIEIDASAILQKDAAA